MEIVNNIYFRYKIFIPKNSEFHLCFLCQMDKIGLSPLLKLIFITYCLFQLERGEIMLHDNVYNNPNDLDKQSQLHLVAERVKMLRKEKKWSQAFLAQQIGISAPTVNRWEKAERKIDQASLLKLSQLFNVPSDYIIGISNDRTPPSERMESTKQESHPPVYTIHEGDFSQEELLEMDFLIRKLEGNRSDLPPQVRKQLREIIIAYLKAYPRKP